MTPNPSPRKVVSRFPGGGLGGGVAGRGGRHSPGLPGGPVGRRAHGGGGFGVTVRSGTTRDPRWGLGHPCRRRFAGRSHRLCVQSSLLTLLLGCPPFVGSIRSMAALKTPSEISEGRKLSPKLKRHAPYLYQSVGSKLHNQSVHKKRPPPRGPLTAPVLKLTLHLHFNQGNNCI